MLSIDKQQIDIPGRKVELEQSGQRFAGLSTLFYRPATCDSIELNCQVAKLLYCSFYIIRRERFRKGISKLPWEEKRIGWQGRNHEKKDQF